MRKIIDNGIMEYLISVDQVHQKLKEKIPTLKGKIITAIDSNQATTSIHYLETNMVTEEKIEDHKIFFVQEKPEAYIITNINFIPEIFNINEKINEISKRHIENNNILCVTSWRTIDNKGLYYFITPMESDSSDSGYEFIEIRPNEVDIK